MSLRSGGGQRCVEPRDFMKSIQDVDSESINEKRKCGVETGCSRIRTIVANSAVKIE